MTGTLRTYDDNCVSLSCDGSVEIINGVIREVNFKGYPRMKGDEWATYYKEVQKGDQISQERITKMLSYDGVYNIISYFKER